MTDLAALVVATLVLVLIPGPNVALIVANSLSAGFRSGVITVLGTTAGVGLQLLVVALGLTVLVEIAADALRWIRWAGVAYLVWLGLRTWSLPADDIDAVGPGPAHFWRGCAVAAVNPKTLLFNAAFVPQFVTDNTPALLVVAVYLLVVLAGDLAWAAFSSSARPLLSKASGVRNRLTGAFLVAAGVGLAISRRGS